MAASKAQTHPTVHDTDSSLLGESRRKDRRRGDTLEDPTVGQVAPSSSGPHQRGLLTFPAPLPSHSGLPHPPA